MSSGSDVPELLLLHIAMGTDLKCVEQFKMWIFCVKSSKLIAKGAVEKSKSLL